MSKAKEIFTTVSHSVLIPSCFSEALSVRVSVADAASSSLLPPLLLVVAALFALDLQKSIWTSCGREVAKAYSWSIWTVFNMCRSFNGFKFRAWPPAGIYTLYPNPFGQKSMWYFCLELCFICFPADVLIFPATSPVWVRSSFCGAAVCLMPGPQSGYVGGWLVKHGPTHQPRRDV